MADGICEKQFSTTETRACRNRQKYWFEGGGARSTLPPPVTITCRIPSEYLCSARCERTRLEVSTRRFSRMNFVCFCFLSIVYPVTKMSTEIINTYRCGKWRYYNIQKQKVDIYNQISQFQNCIKIIRTYSTDKGSKLTVYSWGVQTQILQTPRHTRMYVMYNV